ncbi:MAG: hypothetical protein NUW23_04110, partial [Firmicutes bacterium]|nr:hypothetical protein [Bacillota bacterium]
GFVKVDNLRSAGIVSRMGAVKKGDKYFLGFPVFRKRGVRKPVTIQRRIDVKAEYQETMAHYHEYDLWPIMDGFSHFQGLTDECLVAKLSCGSSSMKVWDNSHHFDRMVDSLPVAYRVLGAVVGVARHVVPMPKVPKKGEVLRVWTVYDVMTKTGCENEVRGLMAQVNNMALERGIDYVVVVMDGQEPELAWLKRASIMPLGYNLFVKEYQPVPALEGKTYYDVRYL